MSELKEKRQCGCGTEMRTIAVQPITWWCPDCREVCQERAGDEIWLPTDKHRSDKPMSDFKFELGDTVIYKAGFVESRWGRLPRVYVVVERHTAECHGGTQRFYTVGQTRANEDELMKATGDEVIEAIADGIEFMKKHRVRPVGVGDKAYD